MLICIPFDKTGQEQVEKLLDYIYLLNGRTQLNSCLLMPSKDVHDEYQIKAKISAEMAFKNVSVVKGDMQLPTIASAVHLHYKSPWLLVDAFCVPLIVDWVDRIANAYEAQPKKYMGANIKRNGEESKDEIWLARQSVYPATAATDFAAKLNIFEASTKTPLIQVGKFTGMDCLRPDAALYCSDVTGKLIENLRETLK